MKILKEFTAELLGTAVLILFGCGCVAQTVVREGFISFLKLRVEISSVCRTFTLGRHKVATGLSCPSLPLDHATYIVS